MKYAYEDLSESQFEELVVLLCQQLLGIAVQGFAKGPDGGRDAKFVGTAELHPSKAAPWTGVTIIQAKHTNGHNRGFSEVDFYSTASVKTVIGHEIPRIKNLRNKNQLDNYMLFANRRLAGNAESEIGSHIAQECGIPPSSVYLCGLEQLEMWLKRFPEVPASANIDPVDSPLIASPDDIAEIVQALARHCATVLDLIDDAPVPRTTYAEKNRINNMSGDYAVAQRKMYLKDTRQIQTFLAAPENREILKLYETAADEFELKIIAKRKDFQSFDNVMEYLVDQLYMRDATLRQLPHKRLTRAMLFYMYWNCDIGQDSDAQTN